jgi:hypothetical protein
MRPEKIGLASFSNPVPHLHWHVFTRYTDDVNFLQPVWGQVQRAPQYQLASGFDVSGKCLTKASSRSQVNASIDEMSLLKKDTSGVRDPGASA